MGDKHPGLTGPHPKSLPTPNKGANSTYSLHSLSFLVYSRADLAQQAPTVSCHIASSADADPKGE